MYTSSRSDDFLAVDIDGESLLRDLGRGVAGLACVDVVIVKSLVCFNLKLTGLKIFKSIVEFSFLQSLSVMDDLP